MMQIKKSLFALLIILLFVFAIAGVRYALPFCTPEADYFDETYRNARITLLNELAQATEPSDTLVSEDSNVIVITEEYVLPSGKGYITFINGKKKITEVGKAELDLYGIYWNNILTETVESVDGEYRPKPLRSAIQCESILEVLSDPSSPGSAEFNEHIVRLNNGEVYYD